VREQTAPEDRLDVLDSLAVTFHQLGRTQEAIESISDALRLAVGPEASRAWHLRSSRAALLVLEGRSEEALDDLRAPVPRDGLDPPDIVNRALVWTAVAAKVKPIPEEARADLEDIDGRLADVADGARRRRDVVSELGALRARASLKEWCEPRQARELWEASIEAALASGQPPDPIELVTLGQYAWRGGDRERARDLLCRLPAALAARFGGVRDLASAVNGAVTLRPALDRLVSDVVFDGETSWEDARLVSELRRDAIGRVRTLRRRRSGADTSSLSRGLGDDVVARLAPRSGAIAVVEWVDDGVHLASFLTRIDHRGEVSAAWLELPDIDLADIARRLPYRLSVWRRTRPGDPFALPEWMEVERWLQRTLTEHVNEGDRVVFVEHADLAGLPWHAAAAPRWPASYASEWSGLLQTRAGDPRPRARVVGVVLVPRFREKPELLAALRRRPSARER
jgi:hypothetical protein